MARKLVRWAVRSPTDRVLDPSFGGFVFLDAAHERLADLGAAGDRVGQQIYGAELDTEAHAAALQMPCTVDARGLVSGDFLGLGAGRELPLVDAVVGNPPYVRYQGFNASGTEGHDLAARAGVRLTRLASSWAPFVVHATSFLEEGGRMAQVLPAEILHAQYAEEVLAFLRRSFATVTLVMFERRVFPGALEEVVLLLADGRALAPALEVRVVEYVDLEKFEPDKLHGARFAPMGPSHSRHGLLAQLLPTGARELYGRLADAEKVRRLGDIASVDIGAVTGANAFFLVGEDETRIPAHFLRPAVSKAAHVRGARLTALDMNELASVASRKPGELKRRA